MDRAIIRYLILLVSLTDSTLGEIRQVPAQYATIQAAIDASVDGDVVLVAPGTYTGDGNRDIDFKGKAITVRSESGAETCVIDCQAAQYFFAHKVVGKAYHRGFHFHTGEDASSILQGFTIANGYARDRGGAVFCYMSSPCIKNCIITGNVASEGGGIACFYSSALVVNSVISCNTASEGGGIVTVDNYTDSNPMFARCIISGNRSGHLGGGVMCGGDPVFVNCVISGNRGDDSGGGLCTGAGEGNTATLQNCIIWRNTARFAEQIDVRPAGILGTMRLRILHSLVDDGESAIWDPDNRIEGAWISPDPLFVRLGYWDPNGTPGDPNDDFWLDGDYHLKSQAGRWDLNTQTWVRDEATSLCIDAGDPASPIGLEPFPNGGIINMGAYGGTAEASKSYFGEPVCETIVAGDLNGDCKVDFKDLVILASHWLTTN